MRVRVASLMLICAGLVLGCAGGEEAGEAADEGMAETAAGMQQPELPDTTAQSLWAYLQQVDYRNDWQLWPDKGELYTGREPHGMLLTTYVNDVARQALTGMAESMPAGAIIVKENYMADSTLAATTVMYKSGGYNPEHNDWFWLKRLADGTTEVAGRGQGCIACHGGQAQNDYIFTSSLGGM